MSVFEGRGEKRGSVREPIWIVQQTVHASIDKVDEGDHKANIHLLGEVDPVMFSVNVCIARIPHQHL